MMTKFHEINWNPSVKERRALGWLLLASFPFVGLFWTLVFGLRSEGIDWNWAIFKWIAGIGSTLGGFCVVAPGWSMPVYKGWHTLVCTVDTVVSFTLLTVFYYLLLCPYSLLVRLLIKRQFKKGTEPCESYWNEVAPPKSTTQYYRQY